MVIGTATMLPVQQRRHGLLCLSTVAVSVFVMVLLAHSYRRELHLATQAANYPENYSTLNTDMERECLYKYLKDSQRYLEFGSGGSTFDALKIMTGKNKVIYSVEGSESWCDYLKQYSIIRENSKINKLHLICVYIGPTTAWSYPLSNQMKELFSNYYSILHTDLAKTFDTVLIDGRFRVSCALEAVLTCNTNVRILIHDFPSRPTYHVVLKYLDVIDRADDLYVFTIKKSINSTALSEDLQDYKYTVL